jgi:hypothetical protein
MPEALIAATPQTRKERGPGEAIGDWNILELGQSPTCWAPKGCPQLVAIW